MPKLLRFTGQYINQGISMGNALIDGAIRFSKLTEDRISLLWPKLHALSADQEWMLWAEDNYTRSLPGKWDFSRAAYLDGELVGYFICSIKGDVLWVHRLVVRGAARGQGIGAVLLREILVLAESASLLGVVLKAPADIAKVIKFYSSFGFRQVSSDESYVTLIFWSLGKLSVGVHQPNYLPWLGYFYKMSISNVFIFLDDVIFPKGSYVNRNKICISGEAKWLTVPTGRAYETTIVDSYPADVDWVRKHLRTLEMAYGRAPFFNKYFLGISELLKSCCSLNFAELNISLIKYVAELIGIHCIYLRSSQMNVAGKSDVRLAQLVEKVGGGGLCVRQWRGKLSV